MVSGRPYTIFGYKGKQVRDNIHSHDLVTAFWHFFQNPRAGEVYNIGGSRHANVSMVEAIDIAQLLTGKELECTLSDDARIGDHIWYVSDVRKFQAHYPEWAYEYDMERTLREMVAATEERERKA